MVCPAAIKNGYMMKRKMIWLEGILSLFVLISVSSAGAGLETISENINLGRIQEFNSYKKLA